MAAPTPKIDLGPYAVHSAWGVILKDALVIFLDVIVVADHRESFAAKMFFSLLGLLVLFTLFRDIGRLLALKSLASGQPPPAPPSKEGRAQP